MPELPEVEIERQYLHRTSLGKEICHVTVAEPWILRETGLPALTAELVGHIFVDTRRYGKYLFAILDNGSSLVFHFGMTGGITAEADNHPWPPYTRLALRFSDGSFLAYHDPRKLGRIFVTADRSEWIRGKGLGPDALVIRQSEFRQRLSHRRGMIKPLLMNQEVIAGIGNLYADEILFRAGIHPARTVPSLGYRDLQRIYSSMRAILATAIRCNADETCYPQYYLIHHRFPGGSCPNCGTPLEHRSMNGRTAYFCPKDQPS